MRLTFKSVRASKFKGVDISVLKIRSPNKVMPSDKILVTLLKSGTKPMDALLFLSCSDATVTFLEPSYATSAESDERILEENQRILAAKTNMAALYLYIMMRGSYPSLSRDGNDDLPNFIKKFLNIDLRASELLIECGDYPFSNLTPTWVKNVDLTKFSKAIIQRLRLGLPGYRCITPFKMLNPKPDITEENFARLKWVKSTLCTGFYSDIFQATSSIEAIETLGSLNKNLDNLMLECFREEDLEALTEVSSKALFKMPTRDERATEWKSWLREGTLKLKNKIKFSE